MHAVLQTMVGVVDLNDDIPSQSRLRHPEGSSPAPTARISPKNDIIVAEGIESTRKSTGATAETTQGGVGGSDVRMPQGVTSGGESGAGLRLASQRPPPPPAGAAAASAGNNISTSGNPAVDTAPRLPRTLQGSGTSAVGGNAVPRLPRNGAASAEAGAASAAVVTDGVVPAKAGLVEGTGTVAPAAESSTVWVDMWSSLVDVLEVRAQLKGRCVPPCAGSLGMFCLPLCFLL